MYSPKNKFDNSILPNHLPNHNQDSHQLNLINMHEEAELKQAESKRSVDSLLIHNTPSPPSLITELQNLNFQQNFQYQQPAPAVVYRKVRPEPISDKTLVGSVVGFFQDVVGQGENSKHHHQPNHHHSSSNPSSSSFQISEIKEQIEWLHFEPVNVLINSNTSNNALFANSNILLVIGYKTGFSIWTIDMNGVASEALSIKEPNITHVKLLQLESTNRILIAICKPIVNDSPVLNSNSAADYQQGSSSGSLMTEEPNDDLTSNLSHSPQSTLSYSPSHPTQSHQYQQQQQRKYKISIINLITGECLHETTFNGNVIELKSNSDVLCVNSWNRIDAFDLNTFEHRFSINTCYSQVSQSTGQVKNPFALGQRWLAFADNKFHTILSSIGGVSAGIEQSYTATVLNTAKSISKGLVTVVNSVVSKSKSSSSNALSSGNGTLHHHSPRLNGAGGANKTRHDSKEESYQPGICTIVDTKKYTNNAKQLHDENQTWIVAHFMAHHHEPIYALEFNNNGRLLVTADVLGQYFNVFQVNANAFKSTRTVVKHLYSLYRGDTNAKLRNISFSSDSRWLAISTKRGTTHIFPLNSYGGPVNARTHSKPYVVNRTSKHQRTAGFIDQEDVYSSHPIIHNPNINDQQYQMQQMLQQQYDNSCTSPIVINNNPKLKSLLEPFIIPAYGQLKQPNANSSFQSSIISTNAHQQSNSASGLLTAVSLATQQINNTISGSDSSGSGCYATASSLVGLAGSNLATSAALVTENMTNFASNTTNMIQYDNVAAVAVFAESRGYLSPEEPRDLYRLKPANSLFVISDVNGNLVEYVLDIVVDTSKSTGNKPTNDSPIQLKITPKAQWPLQRIISSDEINYPIQHDNPLVKLNTANSNSNMNQKINDYYYSNSLNSLNSLYTTAPSSLTNQSNSNSNDWIRQIEINTHMGPHRRLFMGPQFIFKTFNSNLTTTMLNPASSSVMSDVETPIIDLAGDLELNSLDLTSTNSAMMSAFTNNPRSTASTASYYNTTGPMQIANSAKQKHQLKKMPFVDCTPTFIEVGAGSFQEGMPIMCGTNGLRSGSQKSLNSGSTSNESENIIESIADAMNETSSNSTSNSSSNHHSPNINNIQTVHRNIITPTTSSNNNKNVVGTNKTPAIVIANNSLINPARSATSTTLAANEQPSLLLMNANSSATPTTVLTAPSSVGSNSSGVFAAGSYLMINPHMPHMMPSMVNGGTGGPTINTSLTSFTSSSSASSSSSSSRSSTNSNNDEDSVSSNSLSANHHNGTLLNSKPINGQISSNSSENHSSYDLNAKRKDHLKSQKYVSSLENIQFHGDDDSNLI